MAIVLTDDAFVVLDESQGLQNTGISSTNEDNDDSDIVYTDLPAAFATRLFDAGQLNLSSAFAQANGAAQNDFISLTEGSTLTGFVMSNGDPLLAYDAGTTDPTTGVLAGFTTVDGEAIYLFADEATGLGSSMFLGVDVNGDIVLAGYLEADGTISTVQFEAITNPDSGNHDDPVDLSGLLDVGASGTIDFDFDDLPSSNNLFATLGASPDGPAIVIFGADIQLQADGTPTNTSDMMFMSQAGPNATIGMNNQMFNPGDAAFFAYVNDVNADFLSGWEPNGLTGTEADDADNALYTGGTLDVTAAQFTIAQIQGNGTGSMTLTTYLGAADTARDLLTGPTDGATSPNIIAVNVTIGGVTTTFDSDADPAVSGFDVSGLGTTTVTLTGVDDGYLIEFVTDSEHNRVKIEGTAGKFDIGGFTITEGTFVHEPVGDRIVFEDDGPSVGDGEGTPALTVDDSDFVTDDSASYANLFDVDFGTDGGKDSDNDGTVDVDAVTYSLSIGVGASGLTDTLTGDAVVLSMDGAAVVGKAGAAGPEVFRITVDVNTGEVTLDQSRAVVHDDPDDDEESGSPAQLASADLIALTATATDDDGDTDDHTVGIGDTFNFEDDGPSIDRNLVEVPALTVDDSDFTTNDSADFSVLFDTAFGNDGPLDADDDDVADPGAITYELGINAGASGLTDTLTGDAVVLSMDGAAVVGMVGAEEVFRITVDAETGEVTLDQSRAVVHDDPDDDEESSSPAQLAAANLVTLTAVAVDGDLDHDDAVADIGLAFNFEDDGPSIDRNLVEVPALTVDDSDFTTNDSADFSVLFDTAFGNDGPLDADDDDVADPGAITYELGINAGASGLTDTLTGDAVVLSMDGAAVVGMVGAEEVFRITVDAETGEVTLDQSRAVVHDDPDDDEESSSPAQLAAANLVTLTAVAVDGDLDHDDAVADIGLAFNFEDDGPSIERNADPAPDLIVDETLFGSDAADFSGLFTTLFGNDGPKDADDDDVPDADAITYALSISGQGDDTGLIDSLTGDAVVLDTDGLDIIGTVGLGGPEVFRVSADPDTGEVTLTLSRAVKHDDPLDPDEETSPAIFTASNLVHLTATAYDGDGDHDSATIDIGGSLKFEDDGPAIGPISGGMVDFVNGDTVSNLLGAVPGADGANAKITDFTESFDFGFATVVGVQEDDQTVTYYEDENGNGSIDPGEDNAYFRLSLDTDDTDPANWSYLFETLQDPSPVSIDFDFDELPSGSNLFGVVGESDTDPAILVFGKKVVINAAGNYTNKSDVIHTSQGGTGATIGVNNQMFDPGEGAYFVYIDDPVANYLSGVPGGLSPTEADDADNVQYTGGTVDVTTASITISQMQGNKGATMKLTTFLGTAEQGRDMVLTPDGTSPNIVTVRVIKPDGTVYEFDADSDPAIGFIDVTGLGTTSVVVSGLDKGYTVEWDTDTLHNRVLVEGVAGKFDVGKFSIGEAGVTPDAELDFQVTIEDFDTFGDTAVADFTIGIDGDLDGVITV
jgi:ketosteroid isomerase-like protein